MKNQNDRKTPVYDAEFFEPKRRERGLGVAPVLWMLFVCLTCLAIVLWGLML